MSYDFNDAEPQRGFSGDLIPDGTVALVAMTVRPGGQDDGGWLKASNDGGCLMLDAEFTIDGGDYDRRKLWGNYVIKGSTEGHDKAAGISRSFLRAALESSRGIMPSDTSPGALEARKIASYGDFDGITFCARIGVEKGGLKDKTAGPDSERWPDKNRLFAVTPDEDEYIAVGASGGSTFKAVGKVAAAAVAKAGAKAAAPAGKPAWAS
jgi:hypothetical protein